MAMVDIKFHEQQSNRRVSRCCAHHFSKGHAHATRRKLVYINKRQNGGKWLLSMQTSFSYETLHAYIFQLHAFSIQCKRFVPELKRAVNSIHSTSIYTYFMDRNSLRLTTFANWYFLTLSLAADSWTTSINKLNWK